MSVQTIPPIEEMTASQRAELMEELWKVMSRRPEEVEPPEWHRRVLAEREEDLKSGKDRFITLDEAEALIRAKTR
jgi:hypothetical protein